MTIITITIDDDTHRVANIEGTDAEYDAAWDAFRKPCWDVLRRKLSIHEIRHIFKAVRAAMISAAPEPEPAIQDHIVHVLGALDSLLLLADETPFAAAELASIVRRALTTAPVQAGVPDVINRALKSYRDEHCFDDSEYGIAIDKFLAAPLPSTAQDGGSDE